MERLAVGAGELCQRVIGGMRDRGCDLRTIAIEIAARDGPPDEANWTAHLTTNESVSCTDNMAFIYAYAEVRRGYDLLNRLSYSRRSLLVWVGTSDSWAAGRLARASQLLPRSRRRVEHACRELDVLTSPKSFRPDNRRPFSSRDGLPGNGSGSAWGRSFTGTMWEQDMLSDVAMAAMAAFLALALGAGAGMVFGS